MAKHTALCVLLCAAQVYGHGHVITPPSRVELCKTGGNANCGQIIWEPYSVEGPDGWPADGTIAAGGGHSRFPELNVQTSTRWEKVAVTSGPTKFAWKFLVNHVTKDYKYYITHAGWDSAAPLTRATFETEPFCVVDGGMVEPPAIDEHTCNVPTREGYHIILSVWDVGDTTNSFFNVIDALFSGASPPVPVPAPTVPAPVPTSPVTPPVCATSVHCMYVACMQDPACCESGASCDVYNTHYAQCVQAAPSPSTPPTPMPPSPSTPPVATQAPTPAPPTPTQAPWPTTPSTPPVCATSVACIYAACEKDRACCEEPGASCAYYNSYYAQCVQGTTSPSTPPPTPPVTTPPVPAPVPVTTPPSASCPSDTSGCGCDWTDNGAKCNTDDGSECYCKCCCQHTGQCAWQGGGGGGGGGGSGSTCALPSGLDADVAAVDNTGFATCHGKLRLSGLQLVGAQGEAVQLMGMSSHGLHWFANCYTKESITHLVTRWGINVFRAAMYIGEGGYGNNPALKQTVLDIVQWCKELGIYVIVDWHMLSPGNPNDGEYAGADAFWQDMARTLKDETHVLYEIANEPNGVSWGEVVSYHNRILALIRAEDAETVVLAGTPTWSQDIHEAAARPVDLPHNVMYVFHFYAGSHTHLQSRVQEVASQIPLFVSEWGTSEASGDGGPFLDNAQAFLEGFKSAGSQGVKLSWTSWSLADKAEVSAALQSGACASGDWDSVSCTGSYVRTYIRTNAVPCGGAVPVSTNTPTTDAPTTNVPATLAPATTAPVTSAPTTDAPATSAPTTDVPATNAPATGIPTTTAPTTDMPATNPPTTNTPATTAPMTDVPATNAPATNAPATDIPATSTPATDMPAANTVSPATTAPATPTTTTPITTTAPATTSAPITTNAPATSVPSTTTPTTDMPATNPPSTNTPATTAPTAVPGLSSVVRQLISVTLSLLLAFFDQSAFVAAIAALLGPLIDSVQARWACPPAACTNGCPTSAADKLTAGCTPLFDTPGRMASVLSGMTGMVVEIETQNSAEGSDDAVLQALQAEAMSPSEAFEEFPVQSAEVVNSEVVVEMVTSSPVSRGSGGGGGGGGGMSAVHIVVIIGVCVFLLLTLALVIFVCLKKKKQDNVKTEQKNTEMKRKAVYDLGPEDYTV